MFASCILSQIFLLRVLCYYRSIKTEYDRIQTDESQLRKECRDLEKTMALTKHDLKEVME